MKRAKLNIIRKFSYLFTVAIILSLSNSVMAGDVKIGAVYTSGFAVIGTPYEIEVNFTNDEAFDVEGFKVNRLERRWGKGRELITDLAVFFVQQIIDPETQYPALAIVGNTGIDDFVRVELTQLIVKIATEDLFEILGPVKHWPEDLWP